MIYIESNEDILTIANGNELTDSTVFISDSLNFLSLQLYECTCMLFMLRKAVLFSLFVGTKNNDLLCRLLQQDVEVVLHVKNMWSRKSKNVDCLQFC